MLGVLSLDDVREKLAESFQSQYSSRDGSQARMVGLLFAEASSKLAQEEIIKRIQYFHRRSGKHIDFFCGGYGAYWDPTTITDQEVVTTASDPDLGKVEWVYSPSIFSNFLDEVEPQTPQWGYSGEVDLLLLNAYPDDETGARLDFSGIMVFMISRMKSDGLINSAAELFEHIFRYARDQCSENPTWAFSDLMGLHEGKSVFMDGLMSIIPSGKAWKKGYHYAVLQSHQGETKQQNLPPWEVTPQGMF